MPPLPSVISTLWMCLLRTSSRKSEYATRPLCVCAVLNDLKTVNSTSAITSQTAIFENH